MATMDEAPIWLDGNRSGAPTQKHSSMHFVPKNITTECKNLDLLGRYVWQERHKCVNLEHSWAGRANMSQDCHAASLGYKSLHACFPTSLTFSLGNWEGATVARLVAAYCTLPEQPSCVRTLEPLLPDCGWRGPELCFQICR